MRANIVFFIIMIGNLFFSGQYLGSKYMRSLNRNYVRVEIQFLSFEGDTITFNRRLPIQYEIKNKDTLSARVYDRGLELDSKHGLERFSHLTIGDYYQLILLPVNRQLCFSEHSYYNTNFIELYSEDAEGVLFREIESDEPYDIHSHFGLFLDRKDKIYRISDVICLKVENPM